MNQSTTSLARNHFLDALRGIAALLVLATHLQASITGFYPSGWLASHPTLVATLEHGGIGVDVFFLISGFIVFLAARRVINAGKGVRLFLLKRFLRIFLPYWPIALALAAAYALLPGLSAGAEPIQVNWLKSLTLIPGGGLFAPRGLDPQFRTVLLPPARSLPHPPPSCLALEFDLDSFCAGVTAGCNYGQR